MTRKLDEEALERHRKCAEIHLSLHDHDNILKVFGIHYSILNGVFRLLLEKAEGSLRDITGPLPKNPTLKQELLSCMTMRDAVAQMFDGVAYIHSKTDEVKNKISHRDLKPENILIVKKPRDGKLVIKITDFGSVKQLDEGILTAMTTQVAVYTPLYLDPNLKKKKEKREEVMVDDYLAHDVFGAAEVAYELIGNGDHL